MADRISKFAAKWRERDIKAKAQPALPVQPEPEPEPDTSGLPCEICGAEMPADKLMLLDLWFLCPKCYYRHRKLRGASGFT